MTNITIKPNSKKIMQNKNQSNSINLAIQTEKTQAVFKIYKTKIKTFNLKATILKILRH